ncbi:MAG: metal-dependent transcriptional regulator [Lachnospiraceae bacterium]|nr:metal-dependent transcriptional regulator [Lachnospiraceae bacterium]
MHESGEDYIETIYMLKKRMGHVRSVDIAQELNFSRPSVSRAIGILRDQGLLLMNDDGGLELTEEGTRLAEEIYDKHTTLTRFLRAVTNVDTVIAEKDACRIEHIISSQTFAGIKRFLSENPGLHEHLTDPCVYHSADRR